MKFSAAGQLDSIACGRLHNAMLTENGDVYTWGSNFFGQLGLGDAKDRKEPTFVSQIIDMKAQIEISEIACGSDFTAAISNNFVFTWGCGKKGNHALHFYLPLSQSVARCTRAWRQKESELTIKGF